MNALLYQHNIYIAEKIMRHNFVADTTGLLSFI